MPTSYASAVVDADADRVWALVRDFGGLADWILAIESSEIEGGVRADRVGCVRHLARRPATRPSWTRPSPGAFSAAGSPASGGASAGDGERGQMVTVCVYVRDQEIPHITLLSRSWHERPMRVAGTDAVP